MSTGNHTGTHSRSRDASSMSERTRKVSNGSRRERNVGIKPKKQRDKEGKVTTGRRESRDDRESNITPIVQPTDKHEPDTKVSNTSSDVIPTTEEIASTIETTVDDNGNNTLPNEKPVIGEMYSDSPAPEIEREEIGTPRPLSTYCEVIDPEDFDSKSFLKSINELSQTLQSDYYRYIDADFSADSLKNMVTAVTTTMNNFNNYVMFTQKLMEGVRDQMKVIKDDMHKKVQQKAYDPSSANLRMGLEERGLEAKLALLNKELAKAAEDLVRASSISVESESAAVQAALVAEKAAEEAAKIQADYETRRKAEMERRRIEEKKKKEDEEKRKRDIMRAEEARSREEERRLRLQGDRSGSKKAVAIDWPEYCYSKQTGDFDQGVACIVRADPSLVRESWIMCEVEDQLESTFSCGVNSELISNIVRLKGLEDIDKLPAPVFVAIPHCMSRANNLTKEPVIKAEIDGVWVELQTQEVTMDDKKDLKLAQAQIKNFTSLAVVTRFKKDYMQISRHGGKCTSSIDPRVTFLAQKGAFRKPENFMIQLQPSDSSSVSEVKARSEGKGLLCSSSIVSMEWTVRKFRLPVTMTLPCPSNPAKAKKAAAVKAAKEAKMRNPVLTPLQMLEMAKKQEEQKENKPAPPQNNWYMGSYGDNDDDERDLLYMLVKQKNGKWLVVEDMDILPARLDLLQFDLHEPFEKFVVLRTKINVDAKAAQIMATEIEMQLARKPATLILRQRSDDLTGMCAHIVPANKCDRTIRRLGMKGYDDGPEITSGLMLHEGDVLEISFRGNIITSDEEENTMPVVFNSYLETSREFYVKEVDKFLQKTYPVFRGFIQLYREIQITHCPTKADIEEGQTEPWTEVIKELMAEVLTSIPKEIPETTPRTTLYRAPISIRNEKDPINEDTLQDLATELGDEWQRLAQFLGVKRMRIQAILRNASQNDNEDARYEMLLSWAKRIPRGIAKVPILCQALARSGRTDLAEHLQDMEKDFTQQRKR